MGFIEKHQEIKKCVDFIQKNTSNIIIYAVGCPRQEILAHKVSTSEGIYGVGLCVGASIMFMTGSVKRAPQFMQKTGTEWIYRIFAEPRRLAKRYLVDAIKFVPILASEIIAKN
ncbi:UDP-N-acetyl-D-mannosaminuronic acid transferase [compost metagenome]